MKIHKKLKPEKNDIWRVEKKRFAVLKADMPNNKILAVPVDRNTSIFYHGDILLTDDTEKGGEYILRAWNLKLIEKDRLFLCTDKINSFDISELFSIIPKKSRKCRESRIPVDETADILRMHLNDNIRRFTEDYIVEEIKGGD